MSRDVGDDRVIREQFSVYLPKIDVQLPGISGSAIYRHLVTQAFEQGLEPVTVDVTGMKRTMLRIFPGLAAKLEKMEKDRGVPFSQLFAGYVLAGQNHARAHQPRGIDAAIDSSSDKHLPFEVMGPEQERFYRLATTGLRTRRTVMIEASTGIGKGRGLVAAAVDRIRDYQDAGGGAETRPFVVVATSTVTLVAELYREFLALPLGFRNAVSAIILPGKTEFIDDLAIRSHIDNLVLAGEEVDPGVKAWVKAGGRASEGGYELGGLASSLRQNGIEPAWLADDLRRIARDFPVQDFLLSHSDDDEESGAREILRKVQRWARVDSDQERRVDIVFCTQAMLAIGQKTRWKVLAKPTDVIVDEAHLFEQAVSSVQGAFLSLSTMRARLAAIGRVKQTKAIKQAIDVSKLVIERLMTMDDDGAGFESVVRLVKTDGEMAAGAGWILSGLINLRKAIGFKAIAKERDIARFGETIDQIVRVMSEPGRTAERVDASFSPDRRYPSIHTGAASVNRQMQDIWRDAAVVVASATLYIRNADGNFKCDYMRQVLGLDPLRLDTPVPIVAPYIYKLPRLMRPRADRLQALCPPSASRYSKTKDFREAVEIWLDELAMEVGGIVEQAVGGTLVLCTAYDQVNGLAKRLLDAGIGEDRLVLSRPTIKFALAREAFEAAHVAGRRPILIGLGAAWTGISLKHEGVAAADDFLLTDLVVARLPINLNRSTVMRARTDRQGITPVVNEAMLHFKQGLGRLIRRDGVRSRNIWVLDGRIYQPDGFGLPHLSAGVRRMLMDYPNQGEIE